ncbi:hypothetical protein V8E36_008438 [Tilletia maclaganii]
MLPAAVAEEFHRDPAIDAANAAAAYETFTPAQRQIFDTLSSDEASYDEDDSEDPVSFLADLVDDTVIYEHDAEVSEPASKINMYMSSLQPPAGQRPADWATPTREALSFWTPTANLARREDRYPAQDKATIEYERRHGLRE